MIDARGRSCPEPVVMTMEEMNNKVDKFEVVVDNQVAVENITRLCNNKGFNIKVIQEGVDYRLKIRRK